MKNLAEKYGYTILTEKPLRELSAVMYHLRHDRTGLELVYLSRDEENKTFGIGFETLPFDDTGVFHILEHSVLCGSAKYPVKEPFVELLKSSMNTFLNAMTFPDKTVYPVSSRNDADFLNLVGVYLDAVFAPRIYRMPEIFRQEGWHYETDENGQLSYKGVVFNEMKGAFADEDEAQEIAMSRALFPDSPYRFVSGGDPAAIPDLTYEQFVETHRKHYSPSNAYVFVDGDVNMDAVLSLLDEYLKDAEVGVRLAPPALQQPVNAGEITVPYEIPAEEDAESRYRLARCGVVGSFADRERLIAAQLLSEVLCGNNHSVLCEEILQQGLAEDVNCHVTDGVLQPTVRIEVKNFKEADRGRIEQILNDTLQSVITEGVDREELTAAMTNMEFSMRERDYGRYPLGIILNFAVMESWLYGGEPDAFLQVGDLFENLKKKMEEGYFEQLLRELFPENPHSCTLLMVPSKTEGEERRQREAERLAAEQAGMSEQDLSAIRDIQSGLEAWQQSEDTPEALSAIPKLTIADLPKEPREIPTAEKTVKGIPVLYHDVAAAGISYVTLYFDASCIKEEELPAFAFMTDLLRYTATKRRSAGELDREVRLCCGSLSVTPVMFENAEDPADARLMLKASFSALEANVEKALELVIEILTETTFEDDSEIFDILRQNKSDLFQQVVMSGASVAMVRTAAMYSPLAAVSDKISGIDFYRWLAAKEKAGKTKADGKIYRELLSRTVNLRGLTLSVTGGDVSGRLSEMLKDRLPSFEIVGSREIYGTNPLRKEGFAIPADISFAVRGGDILQHGGTYSGASSVAARIVSLAYLWNVIRVQGGAYGTGIHINRDGLVSCYSYRDPNAAGSLEAYTRCGAFLKEFCSKAEDLTGFIVGAISDASPVMTARMKGGAADTNIFTNNSEERRRRIWTEILNTTVTAVADTAEALDLAMQDGGICVVGSMNQLQSCGLDVIESV